VLGATAMEEQDYAAARSHFFESRAIALKHGRVDGGMNLGLGMGKMIDLDQKNGNLQQGPYVMLQGQADAHAFYVPETKNAQAGHALAVGELGYGIADLSKRSTLFVGGQFGAGTGVIMDAVEKSKNMPKTTWGGAHMKGAVLRAGKGKLSTSASLTQTRYTGQNDAVEKQAVATVNFQVTKWVGLRGEYRDRDFQENAGMGGGYHVKEIRGGINLVPAF
jgi:hypothetical protein